MKVRRSMIIVPGNVPEYLEKSRNLEVDVLTLDLQDSLVNVDEVKLEGRAMVVAALRKSGTGGFKAREVCVRVNSPSSQWFEDDIKAVVPAGAESIRLTHAYGVEDVLHAERCIKAASGGREVDIQFGLDMPQALMELEDIARQSTLISGISLSPSDFTLEMGSSNHGPRKPKNDDWLFYARSKIVTIARAKGWNAGDLSFTVDHQDTEAFRESMMESRAFGFDGTALIYPRTIPMANEVFGVSATDLDWAQNFVSKWDEQDKGPNWKRAFRMIDGKGYFAPTYEYAQRLITLDAVLRGDPQSVKAFREYGLGSAQYLSERRAAAEKPSSRS